MTIRVALGYWALQKEAARAIRYDVFVVEQKVPVELEWDDMDAVSVHAIAYDEQGQALGTGRLLPDGHIGRMAVRMEGRGNGVGGEILEALMHKAQERGDACVVLNAQTHAAPFYLHHGFEILGEEFMEAGILHVEMWYRFR